VKLLFKESFAKDLDRILDNDVLDHVKRVIASAETARTVHEIPHIKKLRTSSNSFRIRVGQHRIGLIIDKGGIIFVRCLHRRDIYRYFP
jgi:mRNA interferase RelE/StbE